MIKRGIKVKREERKQRITLKPSKKTLLDCEKVKENKRTENLRSSYQMITGAKQKGSLLIGSPFFFFHFLKTKTTPKIPDPVFHFSFLFLHFLGNQTGSLIKFSYMTANDVPVINQKHLFYCALYNLLN